MVDFCIEWNEANDPDPDKKEKEKVTRRKATQADWDAFFGG